jgi:hypothetical protein
VQTAENAKRSLVWWKMSGVGVANLVQLGRLIKYILQLFQYIIFVPRLIAD